MSSNSVILRPGNVSGRVSIELPRSKSIANRLLVMQALSKGGLQVEHPGDADDVRLLQAALHTPDDTLWLGHAGTALRFSLAWAAITPGERLLTGSERLSERPIAPLVDALRSLGAHIEYRGKEGFAPIWVKGAPLKGGSLTLDATVSSQFITALMLIAPYLKGGLQLFLSGKAVSAPYIEMTASLMTSAGAKVEQDAQSILIAEGGYAEGSMEVEPDWSAASYFYSAVALNPQLEILLEGLQEQSLQGDAVVSDIYRRFGVDTRFTQRGALISHMEIFDDSSTYDFISCPDLAQTVAVTVAGLRLPFLLNGLQTLRVKETDRISALAAELRKCGVGSEAGPDSLGIRHFSEVASTPHISTYHDHRMAMAFAPIAFALGEVAIEDHEVVSKSFPHFWKEMGKIMEVL